MTTLTDITMPFNVKDIRQPAIDAEIVETTPELAQLWLTRNVRNRGLKPSKIEQFARDMVAGNWHHTGEAIKFAPDGSLLDGQNRLHAIIKSGVTIPLLVIRGIAPEAQGVMDTGSPRTGADALTMRGITQSKDVATAASTLILYSRGFYRHCMVQSNAVDRPTHSEIVAMVERYPQIVESAMFARSLYKTLPLPVGPLAVAHTIFVRLSPDDAAAYFDSIANLNTRGKGDPVHTLLKRVSETRSRRERIWPSTALFLLFRSWNAYRNGEDLVKFQLGSDGRGWAPMPKPI